MPRSPAEATRFTSTGPHAYSKASASTINLSTPPPPNETPAQKVARLREAARRAKLGQESTWDRIVLRGRVWADRAHRVTATALIGSSIVAAGFAGLSLVEMMMHNRSKKNVWFKEQEENYQKALALARRAEADGTLTDSLRMFLVKERALEQVEAEKKEKGNLWTRAKRSMFGDLAVEEKPGGALGLTIGDAPRTGTSRAEQTSETSPEVAIGYGEPAELKAADDIRKQLATSTSPITRGGPLDRLGEQAASSIATLSRGWLSGGSGR